MGLGIQDHFRQIECLGRREQQVEILSGDFLKEIRGDYGFVQSPGNFKQKVFRIGVKKSHCGLW